MAYSGLLTKSATLVQRGDGAPDDYGDATPAWLSTGPYPCELQQLTSDELALRSTEETLWRVFLPSGLFVSGVDHLLIDSEKYEATGDANHVYNPRTRREHHVEVEVRRVS
jgi:hypothetical protein